MGSSHAARSSSIHHDMWSSTKTQLWLQPARLGEVCCTVPPSLWMPSILGLSVKCCHQLRIIQFYIQLISSLAQMVLLNQQSDKDLYTVCLPNRCQDCLLTVSGILLSLQGTLDFHSCFSLRVCLCGLMKIFKKE